MWKVMRCALFLAIAVIGLAQPSRAETIIKFGLSEIGSDVQFDGTTFSTVDDGDGSTLGDQDTRLNFVGSLDGTIADIMSPVASFTLDGVLASGDAHVLGNTVVQESTGGIFSVYDENNNLLLAGSLADGALTGSLAATTGSYFNTAFGTLTAGSLLPFLNPDAAGISIALAGIVSADGSGHLVVNNGKLQPFNANSDGLIDGEPRSEVPEPATAALLLSGALGMALRRRAD